MKIKAIDIGTYSIKIIEINLNGFQSEIEYYTEILLSPVQQDSPQSNTSADLLSNSLQISSELQYDKKDESETIPPTQESTSEQEPIAPINPKAHLFLKENHLVSARSEANFLQFEGKTIWCYPSSVLTSRFLHFPVSSKKKAEKMMPFQLEKELPYSSNEIHFGAQYFPFKNQVKSIASITDLASFEAYYNYYEKHEFLPDYITSELSIVQNFIERRHLDGPSLILDIGHETTKAYFVNNRNIVSHHLSYVAGKVIDENISNHYNLTLSDAIHYKHKHSFFLTENQYDEVDENQREFALLMKQIFSQLIDDIKKWELGFRINYGEVLSKIYIYGGTSNIKNICNFFTHSLAIKTQLLDFVDPKSFAKLNNDKGECFELANSFTTIHLTATSLLNKNQPLNFRHGKFASAAHDIPSLYSSAFIGVRILTFSLLLIIFLLIERVLLVTQDKSLSSEITRNLQKPEIAISKVDQHKYIKKPEQLVTRLHRQKKDAQNEVVFIENNLTNAIHHLISLHQNFKTNMGWEFEEISIISEAIVVKIKMLDDIAGSKDIKNQLSLMDSFQFKVSEDNANKTLLLEHSFIAQKK